jgi:hypothetical protein
MGNLIAASSSIGIPLFNHLVTVPYLFHPHKWGGEPWKQPHFVILGLVTFALNVISLMLMGTISGMMTTKKECQKINLRESIRRSLWVVLGYMVGNLALMLMPFIKAPILVMGLWMPYAGWLVHGLCVSAFVLFFGAIGNGMLRKEIC